ncbi:MULTISPECIES: hypothetical protein [unclassified Paenibacillus]|uniref:hypothetical protein n=1 Tax=unclassified Paenibacillus TaxID=185978 RepID=UPI0024061FE3|nr:MULTISPECIES: hypothetical protein [unclassified Paenibacillus]MDF9845396.1 hypothetical protein [Paenibacillus sp. PastF-2]MDF9851980.1 hypothetical protein [Paenibacillus sp. PastM-2]MDF9858535.1 hypothetical protein [Paenibacillus sp. PastF-1]MDH6483801.1 hypothetical protein [Paenibacillus sp. PastH-2]MDH6511176.1 hypothetical protein [Paenibacillus sp. PastM-3]
MADIKIGDGNKINKSSIGHQTNTLNNINEKPPKKKTFSQRHPILLSVIISLITGFVLLFSFWKHIVEFIESLF